MANGKGSGCLANGALTVLVVAFVVGAFFLGAFTEHETGMVFGDAAKVTPRGQQADAQGGEAPDGATDGGASEASGTVLYDGDDMKVTYIGLDEAPGVEAANLVLEVENKTGKRAMLMTDAESSSVNGYNILMMQGMPTYIDAGNKGRAAIVLTYQQFGAEGIGDIEEVYMDLELVDADSISDVLASAPISMTF